MVGGVMPSDSFPVLFTDLGSMVYQGFPASHVAAATVIAVIAEPTAPTEPAGRRTARASSACPCTACGAPARGGVGHGGGQVALRGRPAVLHVFLQAPFEQRVQRMMRYGQLSRPAA